MKAKIKLLCAALALLNAVSAAGAAVLTLHGGSLADAQSCNFAAQRWDPSGGSAQVSCFLTEDAGFNTDNINYARAEIDSALSTFESKSQFSYTDAYSSPAGSAQITCDSVGRSEAELTAVGGDFFLFRDFKLLSGAYFSDRDIMQDGAVIDRDLSWALYGSENTAGLNIYINDMKFYIAGVIDTPQDKYQKKASGKTPKAYISYDGASQLGLASAVRYNTYGEGSPPDKFDTVTCYECILPNIVEDFAYNTVKDYFKNSYKGKYTIVNNSCRFDPSVRAKAYKKRAEYAMQKNTVAYPCWENASRITDFKLSEVYFRRNMLLIIPVLTAVCLLIILLVLAKKRAVKFITAIPDKINTITYKRKQKTKES